MREVNLINGSDMKLNQVKDFNNFEIEVIVALSSSNSYVPFLSTIVQSLFQNRSDKRYYRIVILSNDITEQNKVILYKRYKSDKFCLEFVDISIYLNSYKFYTRDHITPMTYMRLAILDIFENHDKVVYLDCDCIVDTDIAHLFDINIDGKYLAATKDTVMAAWMNSLEEYADYHSVVNQKEKFQYFNAGVLLLNLKELRKDFTAKKLFDIATARSWKWFDQDVLNYISSGKVEYLDNSWNFMAHDTRYTLPERMAPDDLFCEYKKAEGDPKIIHYAGNVLPCFCPSVARFDLFWKYARYSPYYEQILDFKNDFRRQLKRYMKYLKYLLLSRVTFGSFRAKYISKLEKLL